MNTILAIGGSGTHSVVIGGRAIYKNTDNRDMWDAHKKYGNPKFIVKAVNDIMLLPEYVEDKELLIQVLKAIWDSPIEKIYNGIIRSTELDEPLIISRRTLFWKIKELIESIILLHMKIVQKSNIQNILSGWTDEIKKNKIETSSVILWSLFGQPKPYELFRDVDYKYLGYCVNASNFRIKELLKFPVDKIIGEIKNANSSLDLSALNFNELNKLLIEKLEPISISSGLSSIEKPIIKFNLESFMEAWLDLNDKLRPFLEESENYYIEISKKIETLSHELEKMNNQLLTLIKSSS